MTRDERLELSLGIIDEQLQKYLDLSQAGEVLSPAVLKWVGEVFRECGGAFTDGEKPSLDAVDKVLASMRTVDHDLPN